jgi:pimeloyl-ACP methyl ester carboxylesterase
MNEAGQIVVVAGADLYVESVGDANLPPVLLLHGGMGNMDDFAEVVTRLALTRRVIRMDSRGHGQSSFGTAPLSYGRLEQDVLEVLDALALEQVDIVGFSDGGIVGYRLAAYHPQRVRSLTTIGADWVLPADSPGREFLAKVTADSWRARFPDSEAEYLARSPAPDFDRLVTESVAMWLDLSDDGYPVEDVDSITCPLTLVRGTDDHLSSHDLAIALQQRVPNAQLHELEGAGHAVALTQPDALAEILLESLGTD